MFELNASDAPQGSFQRQKLSNTMTVDTSFLSQGYMLGIKLTKLGFLKWDNHIPDLSVSDYCVVGRQAGIVQTDNHLHFSHQLHPKAKSWGIYSVEI